MRSLPHHLNVAGVVDGEQGLLLGATRRSSSCPLRSRGQRSPDERGPCHFLLRGGGLHSSHWSGRKAVTTAVEGGGGAEQGRKTKVEAAIWGFCRNERVTVIVPKAEAYKASHASRRGPITPTGGGIEEAFRFGRFRLLHSR